MKIYFICESCIAMISFFGKRERGMADRFLFFLSVLSAICNRPWARGITIALRRRRRRRRRRKGRQRDRNWAQRVWIRFDGKRRGNISLIFFFFLLLGITVSLKLPVQVEMNVILNEKKKIFSADLFLGEKLVQGNLFLYTKWWDWCFSLLALKENEILPFLPIVQVTTVY